MNTIKNLKVIVVDDHMMMRTLISQHLKALGIVNITQAVNGKEGLAKIQAEFESGDPFNIAFMDWHMPEMEGIEVLQKCRQDNRFDQTAFVMLTAEQEKKNVLVAVEAGATSYIVKPVSQDDLEKNLKQVLLWLEERGVNINYKDTDDNKQALPDDVSRELQPLIAKGLKNIFSTMFHVEIVPYNHMELNKEKNMICIGRLHEKDLEIILRFGFSQSLLKPLLENIYAPNFLEDESTFNDAACEIVNILSSQVKAFLNKKGYHLELDLPTVAMNEKLEAHPNSIMNIYFSLNESSDAFQVDLRT